MRVRGVPLPSRNGIGDGKEAGTPTSTIPLSDYGRKSMRAVVQRVSEARVRVEGAVVGEIRSGLLVLLGIGREDGTGVPGLAKKVAQLRIFPNEEGRFDRSLLDIGGGALVVSQFTLLADTAKGNRPSFTEAAPPEEAEPLYERFCAELRELGVSVATGVFGARMAVELVNDGPVTIVLDA
jgi:D-tyrosyl-tRNA(Tyr) deacylase